MPKAELSEVWVIVVFKLTAICTAIQLVYHFVSVTCYCVLFCLCVCIL
uniref:Uncharacterized protein n=1 Tax=Anguilla anguilla TaxID=7936 RepID=A0A0E9WL64_ANGAN